MTQVDGLVSVVCNQRDMKHVLMVMSPSLSKMEDTSFCMTFFGEGYSDGKDPALGPPDAKICTQVIGAGKINDLHHEQLLLVHGLCSCVYWSL